MKGFNILAAAGFLLALGAPVLSMATNMPAVSSQTKTPTHHRGQILEQLQVTPQQRQQLADCRAAYRKKMAELNGQLKVKQVELENELDQAAPDQDKIAQLTQQIGDLVGQRLLEKAQAKVTIEKQILTPQQVDQLKTLQQDVPDSDGNL